MRSTVCMVSSSYVPIFLRWCAHVNSRMVKGMMVIISGISEINGLLIQNERVFVSLIYNTKEKKKVDVKEMNLAESGG